MYIPRRHVCSNWNMLLMRDVLTPLYAKLVITVASAPGDASDVASEALALLPSPVPAGQ